MIDPAGIETREQWNTQLQALFDRVGKSYQQLSADCAGISTSTLQKMVTGQSFPRPDTVRLFVIACGEADPQPWLDARQRLAADAGPSGPDGTVRVRDADPLHLGVHRPIQLAGVANALPRYVLRDSDTAIDGIHATIEAVAGEGGFVLVVGGSSVGKTRCLVEAIQLLLPQWWLLHPANTADVDAFADSGKGRRVVMWLDELQNYLGGERAGETISTRPLVNNLAGARSCRYSERHSRSSDLQVRRSRTSMIHR